MGRIDRKKELAEGFKSLMQEMDFDKITIQEIAIRAGSFISSTSRAYLSRLLSPYRTISCPTYGHNAERSFLASFFSDALMLSISNWMINDDGTPPAVMSKRFRYISDLLFPGDTF